MRPEHLVTLRQFDPQTTAYLCAHFHLSEPLPDACVTANLHQADLVLALLRTPHPRLIAAAEALVGHPIVHLPPQPSPPLPRPVDVVHIDTGADARRVLRKAPNPRLPTTPSFQRYRLVRVGLTVGQLIRRGVTRKDIREFIANEWVEFSS
jgi:hypothetical protein